MESLLIFLATGAVAGLLAGLFGVGGGLIMVPALALLLPLQGVGDEIYMQMAIGTSLAVIAATSISSAWSHHRRGGVVWSVFLGLAPGLVCGALLGAAIADALLALTLQRIVGVGALLVSAQMALRWRPSPAAVQRPGNLELVGAGTVIGAASSLIGIGGGSLTVPYLSLRGVDIRQAVGTSAACGMPIAWGGAAGFIYLGAGRSDLPPFSLGYVNGLAFVSLAIASVLLAPLGARLAHALSPRLLARAFALLLAGIGLKMLVG
jgi:uncharacterized protein